MTTSYGDLIERLTYVNYRAQRLAAPHIPPERWGAIYGAVNQARFERVFQHEQAGEKGHDDKEN